MIFAHRLLAAAVTNPPSTGSTTPVVKRQEDKKRVACAMSASDPALPAGLPILGSKSFSLLCPPLSRDAFFVVISVANMPGAMALTRTPSLAEN